MEKDKKAKPATNDRMKALLARADGAATVAAVVVDVNGPKLPFWLGD